jgi:hypothetical protein
MTTTPANLAFERGRPFYDIVMTFLAATIGLGPVFDQKNPLNLNRFKIRYYHGTLNPDLFVDMGQVHRQCLAGTISSGAVEKVLCCMLLNSAYEIAKPHQDSSPEFEVFRHLRNAASHGNRFFFTSSEPRRPASWGPLIVDHHQRGKKNPLCGIECIGATLSPGDALALLCQIESRLP